MDKKVQIDLVIEGVIARTEYGYYNQSEQIIKRMKAEEIQGSRTRILVNWIVYMYILSEV
jgi:hypothetical protein